MAIYTLKKEQLVKASLTEVWDFISSPKNLKVITPDYMGFDILEGGDVEKMYEGMIISYHVRPLMGIKMKWVTEITHVRDQEYFVDEQRVGPYKLWHHQHHLKQVDEGVLMTDIVTYQPPLGVLGQVANSIIIRRQLEEIFSYRKEKVDALFDK